ncbi:hypothetical protein DPMN_116165 [Dreissena polymorpha]|uniref:Uncharacterized protein n=1 Tax=Dreissena polymorpha TaxID=45954 RepID=A0A9D4KN32_DREPO|nr:hypothetical protein DPMN_116165 [Dreissena polymorpha]
MKTRAWEPRLIVVVVLLPPEEHVLAGRVHLYRVLHRLASARQRVPETRRVARLKCI